MVYHDASNMFASFGMEPELTLLDQEWAKPSVAKSKGIATVSFGDCAAEITSMDGKMVMTSVTVSSLDPHHAPLLLLLAAEYAGTAGHELFVPQDTGFHSALDGCDLCSVREGLCAGRSGNSVVYMGPALMKRKREKAK